MMNTIALFVGWTVIVCAVVIAVSAAWKAAGELVWSKLIPGSWKQSRRRWTGGGAIVSPSLLAVMFLLRGPTDILRLPHTVRVQIARRAAERGSAGEKEASGVV